MRSLKRALLLLTLLMLGPGGHAVAHTTGDTAKPPQVTLFTIDFCPSCMGAKRHFEERGIPYQEFNIQHSDQAHDTFKRLGGRAIPFLVINGRIMNGFHPERFDQIWQEIGTP